MADARSSVVTGDNVAPADAQSTAQPVSGRRVYIVDDESAVRRALSFALTTAGFEARAFATGSDFLEELELLAPGCVLLDLNMPGVGGFAVLEALTDRRRRFPVVAITGHGDIGIAVRAMKLGARDFLEKPFCDEALLGALDTVFSGLPADLEADSERLEAIALVAALTPREHELLRGLIAGLSNKGVANQLNLSVRTVEMHRGHLMQRLAAKSLADAVRIAILADVQPL